MTTLADARRELHQLAARRDRLRLRIRRGELVPRRVVGNLAFVTGRRFRDAILAMPARHVPLLAADCGLPTGAFGVALTVALQIDLCDSRAARLHNGGRRLPSRRLRIPRSATSRAGSTTSGLRPGGRNIRSGPGSRRHGRRRSSPIFGVGGSCRDQDRLGTALPCTLGSHVNNLDALCTWFPRSPAPGWPLRRLIGELGMAIAREADTATPATATATGATHRSGNDLPKADTAHKPPLKAGRTMHPVRRKAAPSKRSSSTDRVRRGGRLLGRAAADTERLDGAARAGHGGDARARTRNSSPHGRGSADLGVLGNNPGNR